MIKCIVIDDEELARTLLKSYIEKVAFLSLLDCFDNPLKAMPLLKKEKVDVIFLDIQMPDLKGTDFAIMIGPETNIIFTTAYSEYALEGFELNALDYLLKPITFQRFLKAVNKLQSPSVVDETKSITIKSGYDLYKVKLEDILYIESDSEYVNFHTTDKKIMSHQTLKSLEETLTSQNFLRVHRSYLVNTTKVTGLKGRDLLLSEVKIPISVSYFENVKNRLFL
mgnify:CR=1 FL=1|tara:strand:- start:240186 stop:240857 length:672 start_codon:yes stop_codon:yes gene_type:complete